VVVWLGIDKRRLGGLGIITLAVGASFSFGRNAARWAMPNYPRCQVGWCARAIRIDPGTRAAERLRVRCRHALS
jgi:hypothetical protein